MQFLRHIERCAYLLHVVDFGDTEMEPRAAFETVREELTRHQAGIDQKPFVVALNKSDLLAADDQRRAAKDWFEQAGHTAFVVSAATGAGLEEMIDYLSAGLAGAAAMVTQDG